MAEKLYSPYQLAELLGISHVEVFRWVACGMLPAQSCPDGSIRLAEHELVAFLRERGIDLRSLLGDVTVQPLAPPPPTTPAPAAPADYDVEAEIVDLAQVDPQAQRLHVPDDPQDAPPQAPEAIDRLEEELSSEEETLESAEPQALNEEQVHDLDVQIQEELERNRARTTALAKPATPPTTTEDAHTPPAASPCSPVTASGRPAVPASCSAARQIIQAVLADALQQGASAIYFQQQDDGLHLSLRVGGLRKEKPHFHQRLDRPLAERILQSLRILAGLDPAGPAPECHVAHVLIDVAGGPRRFRISCCEHEGCARVVLQPEPADDSTEKPWFWRA